MPNETCDLRGCSLKQPVEDMVTGWAVMSQKFDDHIAAEEKAHRKFEKYHEDHYNSMDGVMRWKHFGTAIVVLCTIMGVMFGLIQVARAFADAVM